MGKYALILVSALIFSLITYGHALKNALFISNTRTVQSFSQNQAHNIAQSAAMLALNNLRNSENNLFLPEENEIIYYPSENGFQDWPEMEGSYRVQFTNQNDETLVLQSTGLFEETIYRVTLGLSLGTSMWNPNIDNAVHAENSIETNGGVTIHGNASMNSIENGAANISSNTDFKDQFLVGPGGFDNRCDGIIIGWQAIDPECSDQAINALPAKLNYPMPIFPEFPNTPIETFNYQPVINPADYHGRRFDYIDLQGNSSLTINTGDEDRILHVRRLNVQSNDITIIGDGKLTIYVDHEFDLKGNANVNKDGDLNQLMLYYHGNQEVDLYDETLDFAGNTHFNGSLFADKARIKLTGTTGIQGNVITGGNEVEIRGNSETISRLIYAPNANVIMGGNPRVTGSIVSNTFVSGGNSVLTYNPEFDADLPELEQIGGGYQVRYWN